MRKRIHVATDVAMIGAWDKSQSTYPFSRKERGLLSSLRSDAVKGHLFLIHTGADCGGATDIYVGAEMPEDLRQRSKRVGSEFLLSLPTGELVIGGAEDYRSDQPRITGADSSLRLPEGDYSLKCFELNESGNEPTPHSIFERAVGRDNFHYFNKINQTGGLICFSTLLLFPVLVYPLGWKIALLITSVIFLSSFRIVEHIRKRNSRYQRLSKKYEDAVKEHQHQESPLFVFELRHLSDRGTLKGGEVDIT